jgi:hypothetical protein
LEESWLSGTIYEETLVFNQQRDVKIGKNLISFIKANPGTRVVVVLGADHRTFVVEVIEKHFGPGINILPVP